MELEIQIPIKLCSCCSFSHIHIYSSGDYHGETVDVTKTQQSLQTLSNQNRAWRDDVLPLRTGRWNETYSYRDEVRGVIDSVRETKLWKCPHSPRGMNHWKCVNNQQNQHVWAARPSSPAVDPSHPDSIHIFQAQRHLQFCRRIEKWVVRLSDERSVR